MKYFDEIIECVRFSQLPLEERLRKAKEALGLPNDRAPAWLRDDVMAAAVEYGFFTHRRYAEAKGVTLGDQVATDQDGNVYLTVVTEVGKAIAAFVDAYEDVGNEARMADVVAKWRSC